jgi:hypothetical protein
MSFNDRCNVIYIYWRDNYANSVWKVCLRVFSRFFNQILLITRVIIDYPFIVGTFVPKSIIANEKTKESTEEIVQVESKSTITNEPSRFHPESERRFTPPVIKTFKRLSTQTQESPTLESFGLSDHALALLKAG